MRKRPSSSVLAVPSRLVSLLRTVTVALATTAPLGSLIRPPIAPLVVDCAAARPAPKARQRATSASAEAARWRIDLDIVRPFLASGFWLLGRLRYCFEARFVRRKIFAVYRVRRAGRRPCW